MRPSLGKYWTGLVTHFVNYNIHESPREVTKEQLSFFDQKQSSFAVHNVVKI